MPKLNLGKKGALGAAPAKTGKPEAPKAPKASKTSKDEANIVDIAESGDMITVSASELQNMISNGVVQTLASIFGQLADGEVEVDDDTEEDASDSAAPDEDEEEEEEEKPSKKKPGKKKPADDDDEDEEEEKPSKKPGKKKKDEEEEEPAAEGEVEYDPDPFREPTLELAQDAVKEFGLSPKEIKANLSNYLENAPADAPATVKIDKLVKAKKMDKAWNHLVALLIDDNGDVHDFEDAYMRGGEYIYLGGVEAVPVEDTGFVPVKKAKLVNLEDGSETKAPKDMTFSQILFNPVNETYFGINEDQDSIVQVEEAEEE